MGPFEGNPISFFILPGQKSLIKELIKFANEYVPKRISSIAHPKQPKTKRIKNSLNTTSDRPPDQNTTKNPCENIDQNILQCRKNINTKKLTFTKRLHY